MPGPTPPLDHHDDDVDHHHSIDVHIYVDNHNHVDAHTHDDAPMAFGLGRARQEEGARLVAMIGARGSPPVDS